jgi:ribosome-binding protein aMBF1 (putative translation factor)
MEECDICGISGTYVKLYEAISDEGIIKICSKCAKSEGSPIIRKPTTFQLKESERKHTVYERLSKASGFKPKREEFISKEDMTLKKIVDNNYLKKVGDVGKKDRPDLVENFHWIIMRARRLKHLTQKHLASEIGESETAIIMAEKGVLPDDGYKLVSKLQSYLNI